MSTEPVSDAAIRRECEAGNIEDAASAVFQAYHTEIYGFVLKLLRGHDEASEVLSMFAEDIWRGLPGFRWQCSLRAWCYVVARNAAMRLLRTTKQQRVREIPEAVSVLVAQARTVTEVYRRTAVKNKFRSLRDQLSPEDQILLVLRVDRALPFREVALAMLGDADADSVTIERETARLRKAFERVKEELRKLANAEGLLTSD